MSLHHSLKVSQRSDASPPGRYSTDQISSRPSVIMYSCGSCSRKVSASRLKTTAAISGPHSVAAPPINAISTVWKPMKGLNTVVGSM